MMEVHMPSGAELFPDLKNGPNPAAAPSPEESGPQKRIEVLLCQVHEQRACIRRLQHAVVDAEARTESETVKVRKAEAEVSAIRAVLREYQDREDALLAQSRYHQEENTLLQSQINQLYRENYELKVHLSALRHRVANKVVRLIQKVPGLEPMLRKALRLPHAPPAP